LDCARIRRGLIVVRRVEMKSVFVVLLLLSMAACANAEPRNRNALVGHWRYADEKQSCEYSFKADGSFTGEVRVQARLISKFTGRWTIKDDSILYTYLSDAFGRIPTGVTDRDRLLRMEPNSFLIRAANGDERRYRRIH
jgi:hypothetical protein